MSAMEKLVITEQKVEENFNRIRSGGKSVAVVGSMNADYTVEVNEMPQPGETIKGGPMMIHPGGKSANQASSCARLGQTTKMLGAVGEDANADFLTGKLVKAGVDTSGIEHVPGPSGSTVILVDSHGENFVVVSAGSNGEVTPEYVQRHAQAIGESAVLGLCLETPMEAVVKAATLASSLGTQVVLNISPLPDTVPEELIAASDIVILNEHETTSLLGLDELLGVESDWNHVESLLKARGFKRAVITLGAAGSIVLDNGAVAIPALSVKPVDTTGAGDSFMGATLAGLAAGMSLADSCLTASVVSAYSTLGKGAQSSYGSSDQILEFVHSRLAQ